MDLSTTYLGLKLRTPLVAAASPLSEDSDNLKRLEEAGASAVVFHSLFEEQIEQEGRRPGGTSPSGLPGTDEFHAGPVRYLLNISRAKKELGIPVIASLNCTSPGGWAGIARTIEKAGADALELNIYTIPADPTQSGEDIEAGYLEILASVKAQLKIPVAVKLGPYFTNFARFARRLDQAGADGLVLFNRFYQPDIDLEQRTVAPTIHLSTTEAMRLPLCWIALLHGHLRANLAATGGIHHGTDAIKMLMAGADVTMLCSVLLKRGIAHLNTMERQMRTWMSDHSYESVDQFRGCMSQKNCANPGAFERAQFIRALAVEREYLEVD